jgi:predicted membrane GTPase involved in stress response
VIDQTFELFLDLEASDEQCDFPVVYASGVNGIAGLSPDTMATDLEPLFAAIVSKVGGVQLVDWVAGSQAGCWMYDWLVLLAASWLAAG